VNPHGQQRGPDDGESLRASNTLDGGAAATGYGPRPTNLATLTGEAWDAFLSGYSSGYVAGIDRGRELADEEAATLHREAVRVVLAMANLDAWPVAEEKRGRRQLKAVADTQRRLREAS
jgi:hypothetical protein